MHPMVERAQRAVELPEVLELMKKLAEHGLGVFMPHIHPPEGGFAPLPAGTVQLEGNLKVSFVDESCEDLRSAIPVGWTWSEGKAKASASCFCGGASHGKEWHKN